MHSQPFHIHGSTVISMHDRGNPQTPRILAGSLTRVEVAYELSSSYYYCIKNFSIMDNDNGIPPASLGEPPEEQKQDTINKGLNITLHYIRFNLM